MSLVEQILAGYLLIGFSVSLLVACLYFVQLRVWHDVSGSQHPFWLMMAVVIALIMVLWPFVLIDGMGGGDDFKA